MTSSPSKISSSSNFSFTSVDSEVEHLASAFATRGFPVGSNSAGTALTAREGRGQDEAGRERGAGEGRVITGAAVVAGTDGCRAQPTHHSQNQAAFVPGGKGENHISTTPGGPPGGGSEYVRSGGSWARNSARVSATNT